MFKLRSKRHHRNLAIYSWCTTWREHVTKTAPARRRHSVVVVGGVAPISYDRRRRRRRTALVTGNTGNKFIIEKLVRPDKDLRFPNIQMTSVKRKAIDERLPLIWAQYDSLDRLYQTVWQVCLLVIMNRVSHKNAPPSCFTKIFVTTGTFRGKFYSHIHSTFIHILTIFGV